MRISDWSSDVCSSDLVACWAHFRRKIFECHQTSPTPLTTDLLTRIAGLYRIEEDVRGQPPDIRRRQRQEQARPQMDSRPDARRVGKEGVSTCGSRWCAGSYNSNHKTYPKLYT